MSTDASAESTSETPERKWCPLSPRQRRALGVLVEKAKTTPDSYPMTLNALTNGCNQKSNRAPQMNLSADEVEESLEELRELGAIGEIQGGGRVAKYRHYMYDWLGVDKVELAVMAELLLRGEQTVGELRGRASRMEKIADLNELKPVLRSLIEKELVLSLTPEGRGQIVTHNLYKPREIEDRDARVAAYASASSPASSSSSPSGGRSAGVSADDFTAMRDQVAQLQEQVTGLETAVAEIIAKLAE